MTNSNDSPRPVDSWHVLNVSSIKDGSPLISVLEERASEEDQAELRHEIFGDNNQLHGTA